MSSNLVYYGGIPMRLVIKFVTFKYATRPWSHIATQSCTELWFYFRGTWCLGLLDHEQWLSYRTHLVRQRYDPKYTQFRLFSYIVEDLGPVKEIETLEDLLLHDSTLLDPSLYLPIEVDTWLRPLSMIASPWKDVQQRETRWNCWFGCWARTRDIHNQKKSMIRSCAIPLNWL